MTLSKKSERIIAIFHFILFWTLFILYLFDTIGWGWSLAVYLLVFGNRWNGVGSILNLFWPLLHIPAMYLYWKYP